MNTNASTDTPAATPVSVAPCSDAMKVKFEDAAESLAEIADMMDISGFCLDDINEARSILYEAATHLRLKEPESR